MYVRIPENRMSLTVIKSISTDRKAIPLVVIVSGKNIIVNWFAENITGHERITVSDSGYTNKRICII
jgi:2-hydroxy-3-keto-5-methylthiopentenyl-1-phosphate phosphatase